MARLKSTDFYEMLAQSLRIANEFSVQDDTLVVQLEDEEGEIYDIQDVKFNISTRAIHVIFNHDNDEED